MLQKVFLARQAMQYYGKGRSMPDVRRPVSFAFLGAVAGHLIGFVLLPMRLPYSGPSLC